MRYRCYKVLFGNHIIKIWNSLPATAAECLYMYMKV